MKKHLTHIPGIFICLVILIGSVFLTYKAEKIAGEIANKEILTAQDVIQSLQMGGITFKPDTSHNPQNFKVEDKEPTIYQDSYGNFLYIYTFGSLVERPGFLSEYELEKKFSFQRRDNYFIPKVYNVKNLLLFTSMPLPNQDTHQQAYNYRVKIDQVIFTRLNAGKKIFFTGESPNWKARVTVKYYEHWWTDSMNKVHYESYHTKTSIINYKGPLPKQPIHLECSFTDGSNRMSSTREITPKELMRDITLGTGGGNGSHPRENDTYTVKITWDGKTEEFDAINRD